MYKHKGTEVYNGARSIKFRSILKPIPTVLFVDGNRCKIKHASQDRTPICGICRVKGHFRDECPPFPLIKSYLDYDRHDEEAEAPEIKSWGQAHQYVRDREEYMKILHRETELQAMEEKKIYRIRREREQKMLLIK